jgi:hypothetical protein
VDKNYRLFSSTKQQNLSTTKKSVFTSRTKVIKKHRAHTTEPIIMGHRTFTPVDGFLLCHSKKKNIVSSPGHCETFSDKRIITDRTYNKAQDHSAFRKCVIDNTT